MSTLLSPDAVAAHLDAESVVLHVGTKEYFRLNATGQSIWKLLEQGASADAVSASLAEEYTISPAEARTEVLRLTSELRDAGLLISAL